MNIQILLSQAPERLRAYWQRQDTDPERVGWRAEPSWCPIAEWLDFEQSQTDEQIHSPSVWAEEIIFHGESPIATPPVLAYFIDFIDSAALAPDAWFAGTDRVGRAEALVALAKAEWHAAQLLLPAPGCVYPDCRKPVATPQIHGFLCQEPNGPIVRQACWPFAGGLCHQHLPHLIVPPANWWPTRENRSSMSESREGVLV